MRYRCVEHSGSRSFRHFPGHGEIRAGENDGELFASISRDKIAASKARIERFGDYFQTEVPGLVPVVIVVQLEVIHIANKKGKLTLLLPMRRPLLQQMFVQTAAVRDSGKCVDASLPTLFGPIVSLLGQDLDHDFEIFAFLLGGVNQLVQLLLGSLPLPHFSLEAGVQPIELLLQEVTVFVRCLELYFQIVHQAPQGNQLIRFPWT
jgi:hypothetical protein